MDVDFCLATAELCVFCAWLRLRTFYFTGGIEMDFSEKFRAARRAKKLTQQQIADELKIDRSAVAHYESGTARPHFDNIKKVCELLDLSNEDLFDE